jgi:hypothetical protein
MKLDMSCRDYMGIGWCLAFYCDGRLVDWCVISFRYTMKLGRWEAWSGHRVVYLAMSVFQSLKNAGAFVGQVEASQMHYFGAGAIRQCTIVALCTI